ncbi:MAG: S-adenosylmethionine decarboxylase [Candidatus Woesebacteria bacterium]
MQFVHNIPTLIARRMRMYHAWGKSIAIDLYDCPPEMVNDPKLLKSFIKDLLVQIKMKPHGPTYIDRFGDPELHLEGYSAMQFIETSTVTVHLDEVDNRAFIDIFSCQDFDTDSTSQFCKNYFRANEMKIVPLQR